MQIENLTVTGMNCGHCETSVVNAMEDLHVTVVEVSREKNLLSIEFDPEVITLDAIKAELIEMEYGVE